MSLAGTWENSYGSRMRLVESNGVVTGIYESTTGSTGRYHVSGWQQGGAPTEEAGVPVALAIEWHSIDGGQGDASWNWVSALGGQLSLVTGLPVLTLTHLMIASSDFVGLCDRGVYVDKLIYNKVVAPDPAAPAPGLTRQAVQSPLAGRWSAAGGEVLEVVVEADEEGRFGCLSGRLLWEGAWLEVAGFTDINAGPEGLNWQATSVVARHARLGLSLALGGWLELASGELTLQCLRTRSTSTANSYAQTDAAPMRFVREPNSGQ